MKFAVMMIFVAAACGSKDTGDSTEAKTQQLALGDTGFVVDVPSGWTVESPMKGFFSLKGGRPSPQIMVSSSKAEAPDELLKSECEGRTTDVKKETLPGGGALVSCKGPSKMVQGVTTTRIVATIPKGDESIKCHLETDEAPEKVIEICKSIRKK